MSTNRSTKASPAAAAPLSRVAPPPRYVWLHQSLLADISSGRYPVGSLLPTEEEIGRVYGVSRHTVREATRKLVDAGLILRQKSLGTVVLSSKPSAPYVAALGSLKELMEYTSNTRLEVLSESETTADVELSRKLGCEVGSPWVMLETRRHLAGQVAPIALSRVYLRPEFRSIKDHLRGNHPSVYSMMSSLFGEQVYSVRQDIDAVLMPEAAALLLGATPNGPAIEMLRSYFDRQGRLLTASANLHVAGRFRLQTNWSLDDDRRSSTVKPPT